MLAHFPFQQDRDVPIELIDFVVRNITFSEEYAASVEQKQIAEQIQLIAYDEVPYVSWGQFVVPSGFRKNVQGVLQFGATLLWNISV